MPGSDPRESAAGPSDKRQDEAPASVPPAAPVAVPRELSASGETLAAIEGAVVVFSEIADIVPSAESLPQAQDATGPPLLAIAAHVDGLDSEGRLRGWACAPDLPGLRVRVSVFDRNELVASGVAEVPRPDVQDAGYGDGRSGFVLALPKRLFDGTLHLLVVRCEAQDAALFVSELALALPAPDAEPVTAAQSAPVAALPGLVPAALADGPAATYLPGSYVVCMQPFAQPVYHTAGWHAPESEFTWIAGLEATIEMALRRPHRSYAFTIEVVPNGNARRLQTLEVFFNYFRIGFFEIPSPMTLSLELPAELFILRKARIILHCRQAVSGTDYGGTDSRRLGIAVRRWRID